MLRKLIEGEVFKNLLATDLDYCAEYLECIFENCNFQEAELSGLRFEECEFTGCNLKNIKLQDASFLEVLFKDCNMIGVDFSQCGGILLEFDFDHCQLDYAIFTGLSLKARSFKNCSLLEADFSDAKLEKCSFPECNLDRAVFLQTDLQGADFSSAVNFVIDPEQNRMRGAVFSVGGLPGLLQKHRIKVV